MALKNSKGSISNNYIELLYGMKIMEFPEQTRLQSKYINVYTSFCTRLCFISIFQQIKSTLCLDITSLFLYNSKSRLFRVASFLECYQKFELISFNLKQTKSSKINKCLNDKKLYCIVPRLLQRERNTHHFCSATKMEKISSILSRPKN